MIVTDDEWDFGNLKLCSEILQQKGTIELARKREYITVWETKVSLVKYMLSARTPPLGGRERFVTVTVS